MAYKYIITKTVRFSGPVSNIPLLFEVTYDGGNTWIPYNQLNGGIMSGIDEKNGWQIPHWPNNFGWEDDDWKREKVFQCQHKWIDTGMRKTFCKHCEVEGDYNPMTGHVTVVYKENKDGKEKTK